MNGNGFTEEDEQKLIKFLNLIATHGKFELNTQQIIEYFGCLSHMQKIILPKVKANILEVKRVIDPPKDEKAPETKAKKG